MARRDQVRFSTGAMRTASRDTSLGARACSRCDREGHMWPVADYWGEPAPAEKQAP